MTALVRVDSTTLDIAPYLQGFRVANKPCPALATSIALGSLPLLSWAAGPVHAPSTLEPPRCPKPSQFSLGYKLCANAERRLTAFPAVLL